MLVNYPSLAVICSPRQHFFIIIIIIIILKLNFHMFEHKFVLKGLKIRNLRDF